MLTDGRLSSTAQIELPAYRGGDLKPNTITLRLSDEPVRAHLEEMSANMSLPKGTIAGHALAHLIAKLDTKKAEALLSERNGLVKTKGNPTGVEEISAPGPIIDWLKAAAAKLDIDERALVETAVELWYDAWTRKRPRRAA